MNNFDSVKCLPEQTGAIERKRHQPGLTGALLTATALALGATAPAGWTQNLVEDRDPNEAFIEEPGEWPGPSAVELSDARLKFEINATDNDGGIQVFIDAEPWQWMTIFDPDGKMLFRSTTKGSIGKQGGTELFLESGEPEFSELSLEELLERFPEGDYRFVGRGLEGEQLVGSAALTHNLPDGPELVAPLEGDGLQDPNSTIVTWEPVAAPNGSPIIGYQVLVVQPDSSFPAIPKIVLDVMMPATATSMDVPQGFLLPDTAYEWEVLAIEASGNQTLSSSFFRTAPKSIASTWVTVHHTSKLGIR